LRFYTWQQPTLSLGYFQAANDRQSHAASRDCPLVRRSSGGGAILHDRELTYSLALPSQASAAAARRLYEQVHGSLISTLAGFGARAILYGDVAECESEKCPAEEPFLCFQRRTCFDVVAGGSKIAGSAQRRRGRAVLQHGSVLLAASPHAPELPGLAEIAQISLTASALAAAWACSLSDALAMTAVEAPLAADERQLAEGIVADRFGSPDFTHRR
jgi:lipoate-protein ligase A